VIIHARVPITLEVKCLHAEDVGEALEVGVGWRWIVLLLVLRHSRDPVPELRVYRALCSPAGLLEIGGL